LNDRLDELGYPVKFIERMTKRGLAVRTKLAPPIANLAATAALEHFTATLAEVLLTDDNARAEFGHRGLEHLFLWHALEESEHKAVAFDVYKSVGGSERTRVWTMKAMRIGFIAGMAVQTVVSMLRDRATYHPARLRRDWREFRRSPIVQPEVWRQLRDYDRPDFHPNDRDTTALVDEWRGRLFGDAGELTELLVTGTTAA
jgi:hypothetical protein